MFKKKKENLIGDLTHAFRIIRGAVLETAEAEITKPESKQDAAALCFIAGQFHVLDTFIDMAASDTTVSDVLYTPERMLKSIETMQKIVKAKLEYFKDK